MDQLTRMVESGGVLAEDLLPGLASELNKLYGDTQADGMVWSWNRLKNAVFETAGQIGQTQAVMAAFNGVAGGLNEIVLVLGTGALTAADGIGLPGRTTGARWRRFLRMTLASWRSPNRLMNSASAWTARALALPSMSRVS